MEDKKKFDGADAMTVLLLVLLGAGTAVVGYWFCSSPSVWSSAAVGAVVMFWAGMTMSGGKRNG